MCDNSWNKFLNHQALKFNLTNAQTRVFLTRFARQNWLKRIEDIWELADVASCESFVRHSTNIYTVFKTLPDGCDRLFKRPGAGSFPILRDWLLAEFQRSPYPNDTSESTYLERSPIAAECDRAILQSGVLIRIKAPSKMGKTSLLNHLLAAGNTENYRTVHINLLQIERDKFSSLDGFLRWFSIYISDALDLDFKLDEFWDADRGSMLSCTRYLEMVLQESDRPLVLGLDEVDRLFEYPEISQDFFYLLRSWHEEANNNELWEYLRLIVVYSTENFGKLDIDRSPFNVGLPIELKPFTALEIKNLAKLYHLTILDTQVEQLIEMLGGHPYLVKLAISHLVNYPDLALTEILQQAPTDTGIYNSYLLELLLNIRSNLQLKQALLEVLQSDRPIQIDTLLAYQLYRMGLIQWTNKGDGIFPSCQLYRLYFLPRLEP
jgi:hypothetical protein